MILHLTNGRLYRVSVFFFAMGVLTYVMAELVEWKYTS